MTFPVIYPRNLVALSMRRPLAVIAIWLATSLAVCPGLFAVVVDTSTDSVLDRTGRAWSFYEWSQDTFGADETIVVALVDRAPYGVSALRDHIQLSEAFEEIEGVERVDSLATMSVVRVDESGDLLLEPPLADVIDDAAADELKRLSEFDRTLRGTLISEDGKSTALSLVLEKGSQAEQERILGEVLEISSRYRAIVSGVPVFRVEANRKTRSEIQRYAQATAVLLSLMLFVLFRSFSAVVVGLAPGVVATHLVVSLMGFAGIPMSIATMMLPSMLIALGCAYAMHILVAASGNHSMGFPSDAMLDLSVPLFLSGLTTSIGLLTLCFIRIDAVRSMGALGALGVSLVLLLTLTLVPAVIAVFPVPRSFFALDFLAHASFALIERHRFRIVFGWMALVALFAVGLSKVEVVTDATTWFRNGTPVRDDYLAIRERLSGISPMNIVVSSNGTGSVLEPEVLRAIDGLSDYLEDQEEVGKAISIADPIRQMHEGFFADEDVTLPETRQLSEQYMLMLSSAEIMSDLISSDRGAANVVLRVDDNGSANILDLANRSERWWRRYGARGASVVATGIMYEFARAEDAIAYGQISGLLFALASISVVLLVVFRNVSLALVSLLPNVVPLVIIFGLMGFLGLPIDAGTVLIGGLALGIAVDDTVHLVASFQRSLQSGHGSADAIRRSLLDVLPAICASTATISIGFGVFVFSDFALTSNLGWLTAAVMLICLAADIFLLGPLLITGAWGRRQ